MITPGALIATTGLRLRQRIYHSEDGSIRMLRDDGLAVSLTPSQHHDLVVAYDAAVRPINRRVRWSFALAIPATLFSLVVWSAIDPHDAIDRLPQPFPALFVVSLMVWWPILSLLLHWRSMRIVRRTVETLLMNLPVAPAPPPRPVLFHTLEIVALFVAGPGLVIDAIGSLFPQVFDNTPLMGRSIGLGTVAGMMFLTLLVCRRVVSAWQSSTARPWMASPPVAIDSRRISKIVSRVRLDEGNFN